MMDLRTGDTALLIACRYCREKIANLLLRYGASPDPHPSFGQTALHVCCTVGAADCARTVLRSLKTDGERSIMVNLPDSEDAFPIHSACAVASLPCIDLLMEYGADITTLDSAARTCLHFLLDCSRSRESHLMKCLLLLWDGGADIHIESYDCRGSRPLHLAVAHGYRTIAKFLCESAANPRCLDGSGQTAVDLAMAQQDGPLTSLLLDYAVDFVDEAVSQKKKEPESLLTGNADVDQLVHLMRFLEGSGVETGVGSATSGVRRLLLPSQRDFPT